MRQAETQKHCTDEQLVAHLDGELSATEERYVQDHLLACWPCRGRLKEFEDRALQFAKAVESDSFPGPVRVSAALRRFSEWEDGQGTPGLSPVVHLLSVSRWRQLAPVAVAALVTAFLFLFFGRDARHAIQGEPGDILARVQQEEQALFRNAVHQRFAVEVEQIRPPGRRRSSRLEIWADVENHRFSSRWMGPDGRLIHAAWHPARDRSFVYDAESGEVIATPGSPNPYSLVEPPADGLTVQQLEAAFARWLEGRLWRPISVASDLAVFASEDGAVLDVQQIPGGGNSPTLELTARRRVEGVDVEVRVEIDPATYRPRMQEVRFETAKEAAVLTLTAERVETIPTPDLKASLFEPNLKTTVTRPAPPPPVANLPIPRVQPAVEPLNLDVAELEVRYALHRAGACLGEPVEVMQDSEGRIVVRGIAATSARKSELLNALTNLDTPVWLNLDIQTIEEALLDDDNRTATEAEILDSASAGETVTQFSQEPIPARRYLERYYRSLPEPTEAGFDRWNTVFTGAAVSGAEELIAEAWAIRRLAERFDGEETTRLTPAARYLLEAMLNDHIRSLRRHAGESGRHLEPFLASAAEAGAAGGQIEWETGHWQEAARALFQVADRIHRRTRGLFAGAGLPVSADESASILRLESPEESISGLLGDIRALEDCLIRFADGRPWNLTGGEQAAAR